MHPNVQELHEQVVAVLQRGNEEQLRERLVDVKPADVAEVMELLEDVDRSRTLFALNCRTAAEVIVLLDERVRDEVVDELPDDQLAEMITELPADDAADVLGELPAEESERLLDKLSDEQSEAIEKLLEYDESTAGGLMNPRVLQVPQLHTVREAIRYLRQADIGHEEVFQIYTTDQQGRLSGEISPQRLLVAPPEQLLSDIMEPDPIRITVNEDQENVVQLFMKYDLTSLPVVDEECKLVGHITVDDVMDAAAEEADEDMYHMAGTDAAELETSSIFRASRIRFLWLLPSFLFLTGTATVILVSEAHIDPKVFVALFAFVPMIGALAGSCSVQTSTVITRGLATGELAASKLSVAFSREARIALIMAPACAICAWLLARFGMPILQELGRIDADVSVALVSNALGLGMLAGIVVASFLGISMPFAFRRMGIDPAIAAGPVVTASNDMICVSIYLLLAYLVVSMS